MISLITDNIDGIRTICAQHFVQSLAIVGSATRSDFDPARSDIDVLVDFVDGDIDYFSAFMGLRRDLAAILGRPVDVITLRGVRNPRLLESLHRDAVSLYAA